MSSLLTKPHFFKPLLPGFEDDFLIPVSFFKYLKGQKCVKATLRSRQGKFWPVKINGRRFEDGWKQFVRDHDLRIADFLVFRHEGDLLFDVLVFDRTTCEREYPEEDNIEIHEQNIPIYTDNEKNFEKKDVKCRLETKASPSVFEHPFCVVKLTPGSFKLGKLLIPRKFAREQGLDGRSCSMILKDENGSCWPAKLMYKSSDSKNFIAGGWTSFHADHMLKIGDSLIVELTRNGKIPVLKMQRLQEHPEVKQEVMYQNNAEAGSSSPGHLHATAEPSHLKRSQLKIPKEEAKESGSWKWRKNKQPETASEAKASSSMFQQRFFVAKVASCIRYISKLYIPERFARLHLENKNYSKVRLIDREGRSWPANLWHNNSYDDVYIEDGWNEFRIANKLNLGDSFIFEFIEMGKMPAFKMYGFKTTRKAGKNKETASASSIEKECFFVTMQESYVRNCQLRIPGSFARRNGLDSSICSLMTIMNERGNSWQVKLKVDKCGGVYIRRGWTKFAEENCIKEGDVFMIELVEGGTTPVMKYYAAKQEIDKNQKVKWDDFEDEEAIIERR